MKFSIFLKAVLGALVDDYKKYFWRTLGIILVFTAVCFLAMVLLVKYSRFDPNSQRRQVSLLSYFFFRYSEGTTYSFVDMSKSVYLFFVSLFSIGMIRLTKSDTDTPSEFSVNRLLKKINWQDLTILLGILVLTGFIDYLLFRLASYIMQTMSNVERQGWAYSLVFLLRIYVPLLLFAFAIHFQTADKRFGIDFKKIVFVFVAVWIFNEFAYEIFLFSRNHIFSIVLSFFRENEHYLFESLLGILLMAFYIVGYYSAMTRSLRLLDE